MQTKTFEKMALALPEAREEDHWGRPSYRVRGRIFATLPEDRLAVLKLPIELQETLAASRPDAFSLNNFSHQGWTRIDLTRIARDEMKALLEIAWSQVAPKKLLKDR